MSQAEIIETLKADAVAAAKEAAKEEERKTVESTVAIFTVVSPCILEGIVNRQRCAVGAINELSGGKGPPRNNRALRGLYGLFILILRTRMQ